MRLINLYRYILAELAAEIAANILVSGGIFVVKLFHGEGLMLSSVTAGSHLRA